PRLSLATLRWRTGAVFVKLMERHGFVIITDCGPLQERYSRLLVQLHRFFDHEDTAIKASLQGGIYFNERGIPMWRTGYETDSMREIFRVHTGALATQASW
ncbi:unnamed protein product, partial [Phaeothamnion confervicola]